MNVKEKRKATTIEEEHESDKFQEDRRSSTDIDSETNSLTPEQIEEFFQATEDGSIERLERLFNEHKNADPNMTRFTESLLMAAIRRQRNEVAEYLIDQLEVNVKHAADLHEFRFRTNYPIRQRTFTCRDLAYEKGMMELVDLIDMTNDEVTPNIKRYLRKRLQKRLDIIHETYLKRVQEHNKNLLFQLNEEKENRESPIMDINDENIIQESSILPPIIQHPYKSHVKETIQNIDRTYEKSIDVTGKKSFRFSNYNLHFRLMETQDRNIKIKKQSQIKTTIPSLPIIQLTPSLSPSLTRTDSNRRSISETSTRLSIRDTNISRCYTIQRTTIPEIVSCENKPSITTTTKRLLPQHVNRNKIKHNYISQQQNTLYNQSRSFVPVTLKSTAIGLLSDSRIMRD
ncbi:unnamed protein product [Rotaria sordida]|uniref:Uncharacterized protein n=1 Tax=Rotaria sordida TaxID=392033 RepID=A0A815JL41_9BILA|nr:unnamed protein product [Rotaria sordida]CAF3632828.1 unnamed protein product [Rotaria sordida]